jgi:acetyl esterase/lipase
LPLDIHVPTASASQRFHGRKETPVVLWFHGGGCVQGTRTGMAQHMRDAVDKLGVVVVAVSALREASQQTRNSAASKGTDR